MKFSDPNVKAVFDSYPSELRKPLLALRRMILETGSATDAVGTVVECLKWGQPSYLTEKPKSGSTIRIDAVKNSDDAYALYVHCQTSLLSDFKAHYPGTFNYQGNRALLFDVNTAPDEDALRHCIAMALTYRLNKRSKVA